MRVEIEKITQTEKQEHYRIITSVDVKNENELRLQNQILELIKDDRHHFEKGNNPAFPNT